MQEPTKSDRGPLTWLSLVAVIIPIAFDPGCMDAFSLPKWAALMTLTAGAACACVWSAVKRGSLEWRTGWGAPAFIGLAALIVASAHFGGAPNAVRLGIFGFRVDGVFSWIAYAALLAVSFSALETRHIGAIARAVTFAAIPVSAYGLLQYAGVDPIRWTLDPTKGRVWSTFGNTNFLAAFLAMAIPLSITAFRESPARWQKAVAAVSGALAAWALAFTLSRAALAGAAVGVTVIVAARLADRSRPLPSVRLAAAAGAVLVVIAATLPWKTLVARTGDGLREENSSWVMRKIGWSAAVSLAREKPLFGHGADGYQINFRPHMDTAFFRLSGQHLMSPVYPHNEPLQIAVDGGLAGLALYAVFLGALAAAAWRGRRNPLVIGSFAALAAVWTNNLLSFHNVATASLFAILAGALLGTSGTAKTLSFPAPGWTARFLCGAVLAGAFMAVAWMSFRVFAADRYFKSATRLESAERMEEALGHYREAITLNRREPAYLHQFAGVGLKLADRAPTPDTRKLWLEGTLNVYRGLTALNPKDALAVNGLGTVHARLFQEFRVPHEKAAEQEFRRAGALDPQLAEAWTNLGALYVAMNRFDEAHEAYLKAKDVNPYAPQVYNDLGIFHALQGRFKDAERYWREALEINPNYADAQRALQMLAAGQLHQSIGGKK